MVRDYPVVLDFSGEVRVNTEDECNPKIPTACTANGRPTSQFHATGCRWLR